MVYKETLELRVRKPNLIRVREDTGVANSDEGGLTLEELAGNL